MATDSKGNRPLSEEELQELVAASDAGARDPGGNVGLFLAIVAAIWSIFQVVLASPISNVVLPGSVVNNARQIHLAFAIFLAFAAYPAFRTSPRHKVPVLDWLLALLATFTALY
ncbi:C4-dicarboxylate ABC transporter, partial [Cribrihabitans sp. XS_ASV171]